jgi:hypothetical protein
MPKETNSAMKANLTLDNPLWQTPARRAILDKTVQESAAELESRIKQKVLSSTPAGKTYRRAPIFKHGAVADRKLNRARFNRKFFSLFDEKFAASYKFHRASKRGQPPAVDSGGLLNSIRAKKTGIIKATVESSKNYAGRLDDKNKLDRPFFKSTAEEFKTKFQQNLAEAIRGVKTT